MVEHVQPGHENTEAMWALMEKLFPIHRTLVGPGFAASLDVVGEQIPLEVVTFPSGMRCLDWTIPKAFKVNAAYVEAPDGSRSIDFANCSYHVWNYSQPFSGSFERDELVAHISTRPDLPEAVPLRVTYYREKWGLCASQHQVDGLPPGTYRVHIDTELYDDYLRMGEYYLPGAVEDEILLTCYLCHPMGANDNQSGVVVAVELFKLLAQLPERHYSYRLVVWPEGIGSIVYLASFPERVRKTLGGYVVTCVGDPGPLTYKRTYQGDTVFDRAALHALKHSGRPHQVLDFNFSQASDEAYLSGPGFRLPFGSIMRTPYARFPQYHTSLDNLEFVRPEWLLETLGIYWKTINALERNRIYTPQYKALPFLTRYGIYPFWAGAGEGALGNRIAEAYYHAMGWLDGQRDLLAVADRVGEDIEVFDRPVEDFLRTGLIQKD